MTPQETIARYRAMGGTWARLQRVSGHALDVIKRVADGRCGDSVAVLDVVEAACRIKPSIRISKPKPSMPTASKHMESIMYQPELPDSDDSADFFAGCHCPILNTGVNCG